MKRIKRIICFEKELVDNLTYLLEKYNLSGSLKSWNIYQVISIEIRKMESNK